MVVYNGSEVLIIILPGQTSNFFGSSLCLSASVLLSSLLTIWAIINNDTSSVVHTWNLYSDF